MVNFGTPTASDASKIMLEWRCFQIIGSECYNAPAVTTGGYLPVLRISPELLAACIYIR